MPMERAFAAHVAVTRRELRRNAELSDEVRVLREKNDRLERRSDRLEEEKDRLEETVETLRLQVAQLMSQHGQIVDVVQEHDGRITENRTDIVETQAMVQASDAMLNAWAAQFIEEPPAEDDEPQFEAEDLEGLDEDPDEDPEEDEDDDEDAASNISHKHVCKRKQRSTTQTQGRKGTDRHDGRAKIQQGTRRVRSQPSHQ
ncbi:hypothetical protein E3N88_45570 [Mikania micrantha]|uniref:Uncharacterized protein n=1 Tax=Mikania micrantha TaxID=192012 RepID=A0A5N6L8R4_9ASTR|nr:hypothetical protein E3N88_45570 [Mikania micrantha]